MITQKGKLIIISSPSGGGKNSVINALMRRYKKSTRLITTTTRAMRPGEEHGVDYHFISRELFLEKKAQENFLEYNEYAGNFYGTDKLLLEELLRTYDIVFSQIEVNGRANIQKAGIVHLAIFLMPESLDVLRERIVKRGGL
ncbi:MAG: guanylate kinase, partial [Candidatus Magasanikbacteria bacterium]|nr:guanylate kinase [Candidatus Magasanikbacteria bacterium]